MLLLIAFVSALVSGIKLPPKSDGRSDNKNFQEALNYTAKLAINEQLGNGYYYFTLGAANFNWSHAAFASDPCICSENINATMTDIQMAAASPDELNVTTGRLYVYWDCCMPEASCCYRECCQDKPQPFFPIWNSAEESENATTASSVDPQHYKYTEPQPSIMGKIAVGVFLLVLIVPLYLIIRCLYWDCIKKGKDNAQTQQPVIVEPQSQGSRNPLPPLSPRLPTVSVEGRSKTMLEMQPTVHLQPPSPSSSHSRSPVALNESLSSVEASSELFRKELLMNENNIKTEQKTGLERFASKNA